MSIDQDLVSKKLDFLNNQIHKIEGMSFDEQTFTEDEDIHDLIVFRLQQTVETCVDIATHIISRLDVPQKETAKDALFFLGKKGIIDQELTEKMGKAADFRNRVVHGYNNFDFKALFKDYQENVKDLKKFGSEILKYLETSEQVP